MGIISSVMAALTNRSGRGGATQDELEDFIHRTPFSKYLTWQAYDPDTCVYINADGTAGFLFECTPIVFSSEKTLQISESLLRLPLPPYSVLQFILHADPNIKPILEGYDARRDMNNPLVAMASKSFKEHLTRGTAGLPQLAGIPLRDTKIIVSLKFPADDKKINRSEIFSILRETLSGMSLSPRVMTPPMLLEWGRRLFNKTVPEGVTKSGERMARRYDDHVPIRKQVIAAETSIQSHRDTLQIGDNHWRCITPKSFPKEVDPLKTKELFGAIWGGPKSDNDQHKVPFMYVLNIIYDNLGNALRAKCDTLLQQGAAGSWAQTLKRRQEEAKWCVDKCQEGETFCHIMPVMWLYSSDVQKLEDSASRAKRMWAASDYYMQEDKDTLITALFLASMPFGLRATKDNLNMFERTHIQPGDVVCNLLPIQGGFAGSGEQVLVYPTREGQLCCFDIFSKSADNYNGFVAASTGAGKSFNVNYIAINQYFAGTMIRIVDIGGSYEKTAAMVGGRYLDFKKDTDICINPFSGIVDPEEDLTAIALIVLQMVYSSTESADITEDEHSLAKYAVEWAYNHSGNEANLDLVHEYLETYPEQAGVNRAIESIVALAHRMAFNMREFTTHGRFGKYFNGSATFDIANDRFIVLELEALKTNKDLFKVVTLMVLDAVARDMYLSKDRSVKRMVIVDESWQILTDNGDNIMLREMIESVYRRGRKYRAACWTISQSLLDRTRFGAIGDVIWSNADYKFLLKSPDYVKAKSLGLIDYDEFSIELLKTVETNKPKYSEIFVDTPFGQGIVRLAVDDYSYYVYTSEPTEVAEMNKMVSNGMSWDEAITEMVRLHRSG